MSSLVIVFGISTLQFLDWAMCICVVVYSLCPVFHGAAILMDIWIVPSFYHNKYDAVPFVYVSYWAYLQRVSLAHKNRSRMTESYITYISLSVDEKMSNCFPKWPPIYTIHQSMNSHCCTCSPIQNVFQFKNFLPVFWAKLYLMIFFCLWLNTKKDENCIIY